MSIHLSFVKDLALLDGGNFVQLYFFGELLLELVFLNYFGGKFLFLIMVSILGPGSIDSGVGGVSIVGL